MLPALIIGGAMIASSVAANLIGASEAGKERDKAIAALKDAANEIDKVGAPPDVAKAIILQKFQQAGILTPEKEQIIKLGTSKMQDVQQNAKATQAKLSALDIISQSAKGGLTDADRAALNQAKLQVAQQSKAQQDQILQDYQAKGMGGAGAELAARLSGSQANIGRLSQESDQIAAQASQRALQSAAMQGQLGTQIEAQDFGEQAAKAQAADQIAQFNAQTAIGQQQRNVQASNQAQAANLSNAQQIANANVQAQNAEYQRQKAAQEWMYQQELQKAGMKAAVMAGQAPVYQAGAQQVAQSYGNIGTGINQGLMAGGLFAMGGAGGSSGETSGGNLSGQGFNMNSLLADPYASRKGDLTSSGTQS